MLSLAYRIASMSALAPTGPKINPDRLFARINDQKDRIAKCPKIRLDNVSEFYASHPQEEWCVEEDIPNWAPPFEEFWCEWKCVEPSVGVSDQTKRLIETAVHFLGCKPKGQGGTYCFAMPIDDDKQAAAAATFAIAAIYGYHEKTIADNWQTSIAKAKLSKWVLVLDSWGSLHVGPTDIRGRPFYAGTTASLFINENGKCVGSFVGGVGCIDAQPTSLCFGHIVGLGISFMHCKNVRQVESKEDAGERWHRQYKVPRYVYKSLVIDPMKEVLRRDGNSEQTGIKRALHICRGHFASYKDEKPLFGKYPGTFWIPDHVRGNKEHGEVIKNYDVKAAEALEKA